MTTNITRKIKVKYLRTITKPGFLAGEKDKVKVLTEYAATCLLNGGYAERVVEQRNKKSKKKEQTK